MKNTRIAVLMCLFVAQTLTVWANGPAQEFTKTIQREFSTAADGTTALYNKYGNVKVKTWQNNSVKIEITIVVNAKGQREADETFKNINVNFTNAWGYVKAETLITDGFNSGSGTWWPLKTGGDDFKINYEVWMPMTNQLDLKNKYGNSWVAALKGKLIAEIKYGELRAEAVSNDANLNLGYGHAWLASVKNLYGQVSYSKLNITDANDIQLDTKYSETRVDNANNLRITSKYDDFTLGNVEELRLQTKYANLRSENIRTAYITAQYSDMGFASVREGVDADMTYGKLAINALSRNFSNVNVVGKYTGVTVAVERGAVYRFDAEVNHADAHLPQAATVKSRTDSGQQELVRGFMGNESAKGLVKARLTYGD
ncbi:MAG: hypothetical protein Q7U74_08835, partial [Saprospiraceae bacterium]|nr:hypothetical protein [Saprospiraceae bacterium]